MLGSPQQVRDSSLTGSKVFTAFAPTDRSFSVVDSDDLDQLLTDKEMSRALVLRHTIPGTLYSTGMRFYQLRDSMEKGSTIALYKSNGKIRKLINGPGCSTWASVRQRNGIWIVKLPLCLSTRSRIHIGGVNVTISAF
jgi:uncharacterized surface protein with fasciclin (FAS1) repeats